MKLTPIAAMLLGASLLPVAGYAAETSKTGAPASANETPGPSTPGENAGKPLRKSQHPVDDATITTKIKGKFLEDKQVQLDNIEIETVNGAVRLFGEAKNKSHRSHAIALARQVAGVKSVKNEIKITPPVDTAAAADKKPAKTSTTAKSGSDQPGTDSWITTKVKAKFVEDKQVSATNIHVKTVNGVVQLSGIAGSTDEASKAESIARGTEHVKSVTNDIKVK